MSPPMLRRDWMTGKRHELPAGAKCSCCGSRDRLCLDHTFLSGRRAKGRYLLTVLCHRCNCRKGGRPYITVYGTEYGTYIWFPWMKPKTVVRQGRNY